MWIIQLINIVTILHIQVSSKCHVFQKKKLIIEMGSN